MSQWKRESALRKQAKKDRESEFLRPTQRRDRHVGVFGPKATVITNGQSHDERTAKSPMKDLAESRARLGWEPLP